MRGIGWLFIFGAGISMLAGILARHFVRPSRRPRGRESNIETFIRDEFPGAIPCVVIAVTLLAIGLVVLRAVGRWTH